MLENDYGLNGYTDIFNLLKKVDENNDKLTFFSNRAPVSRNYNISNGINSNSDKHAMTSNNMGHDNSHQSSTNIDIMFDIPQDNILKKDFNITDTPIKEYLELPGILNENTHLQVVKKIGLIYELKNFQILKTAEDYQLKYTSGCSIKESIYQTNFPGDENANGRVALITCIKTIPFSFNSNELSFYITNGTTLINTNKIYNNFLKTSTSIHEPEANSTVCILANLIAFLNLVEDETLEFSDNFLDNISFYYNEGNRLTSVFKKYNASNLVFEKIPSKNKNSFEIIKNLEDSYNQNYADPMNRYTYDSIIIKNENNLSIVESHEYLTFNLNKEEIITRGQILKNSSNVNLNSKLYLIKDMHDDKELHEKIKELYDNTLSHLKDKYDKSFTRFNNIFNPTPFQKDAFNILFIQKYFLIPLENANNLLQFVDNSLVPIIAFFEKVFMQYSEFFGENYISKFMESLTSLNLKPLEWSNNRISKGYTNLKNIKSSDKFNSQEIANYYNFNDRYLDTGYKSWYTIGNPQLTLINDSGNKNAWKKSTREFLKQNSRNFSKIRILDPVDKFQLMVLKRLAQNANHFLLWSEVAAEYKQQPAKIKKNLGQDLITVATASSYSHLSKIETFKRKIENIEPEKTLFVEFSITKRLMRFNNNDYNLNRFNIKLWDKIFNSYFDKEIIQTSKVNLKKLNEVYPGEIRMLDDFVNSDDFLEGISDIESDYILAVLPTREITFISGAFRVIGREFIEHFLYLVKNRKINNDVDFAGYISLLIEELPSNIKKAILKTFALSRGKKYTSYYQFGYDMDSRLLAISGNAIDDFILNRIPRTEDNDSISKGLYELSAIRNNPSYSLTGHNINSVFKLENFIVNLNDLLETSNMLNLSIEEVQSLVDDAFKIQIKDNLNKIKLIEFRLSELENEY
jgi:hypothetical protein